MPPLTITQILTALYLALQTWSTNQQIGAQVTIARDPFHVLEILAASPATFLLVVHWAGDRNISEVDELPLGQTKPGEPNLNRRGQFGEIVTPDYRQRPDDLQVKIDLLVAGAQALTGATSNGSVTF